LGIREHRRDWRSWESDLSEIFFDDETRKSSGLCIGWVIYQNEKFSTQPGSQDIVGHPELTLLLLQPMCAFREEAMVGDFDGMDIEDSLQTPWVYEKIRVAWPKKEKYESLMDFDPIHKYSEVYHT
jgi:hypothetical protein